MRAATVIVGAIAAASIFIALAFILSGGGSGSTTVTTTVEARAPVKEAEAKAPAEGGAGDTQLGGPSPCGGGEFTVENTSCAIGEQIHADYEGGDRGDLIAKDGETGATLTFSCKDETEPITCTGEGGGVIYFGG